MRPGSHSERKEKILEAADRLLRHEGYKRTTIADIAQEASISVGSVYLEFESKDAIVTALSARCFERVYAAMIDAAAEGEPALALQRALEARTGTLHTIACASPYAREFFDCSVCPGVKDTSRRHAERELRWLETRLAEGVATELFELNDRPDVVAGTLLRLLDRLSPAHEHHLRGRSLAREVSRACELLVAGLLKRVA